MESATGDSKIADMGPSLTDKSEPLDYVEPSSDLKITKKAKSDFVHIDKENDMQALQAHQTSDSQTESDSKSQSK